MKVISYKCLPVRMPTGTLIAFWLLMDRFSAPEWVRGVYWTLAGLIVLAAVIQIWRQEPEDVPGFGE